MSLRPSLARPLLAAALMLPPFSGYSLDVSLYGNVSKALMVYDDGPSTDTTIVDNNVQSTRFGLASEEKLDNGLTLSSLLEAEMQSNPGNALTQNPAAGQAATPLNIANNFKERIARVGVAGPFGAVFLGQLETATDDVDSHDLAPVRSMLTVDTAAFGGALLFKNNAGGNVMAGTSTVTPGAMALGADGTADLGDGIRYDTPTLNGTNASLSTQQGGDIDLALRHAATYHGMEMDGAVGYKWINSHATGTDQADGQLFASASVAHPSGLAASIAYTRQSVGNRSPGVGTPTGLYLKLGYQWDSFGVAVDWGHYRHSLLSATDTRMDAFGVGAEWALTDSVILGASYKLYRLDVAGIGNEDDISVVALGLQVQF